MVVDEWMDNRGLKQKEVRAERAAAEAVGQNVTGKWVPLALM